MNLAVRAGDERRCGASVDAAAASAATVSGRRVRLKRKRQKKFRQQKIGASLLIDKARISANPSKPGQPRQGSFQERRGIDANAVFEWLGDAVF